LYTHRYNSPTKKKTNGDTYFDVNDNNDNNSDYDNDRRLGQTAVAAQPDYNKMK